MDKVFINQLAKELKISRSTVYKHIRELHIKTQKDGKKTYLTGKQVALIKEKIESVQASHTDQTFWTEKIYKLIDELRQDNQRLEEEKNKLTLELGQWQGIAKTLEAQNGKLLETTTSAVIVPQPKSEQGRADVLEEQNSKSSETSEGTVPQSKSDRKLGFFKRLLGFK